VRAGAQLLVLTDPWDVKYIEDNNLVMLVQKVLLAGGDELETVPEAIIAVLAWTNGYLPSPWHVAASAQEEGGAAERLSRVFGEFYNPRESEFWRQFLAPPKAWPGRWWDWAREVWREVSISVSGRGERVLTGVGGVAVE
jgi:hypothetical protein